MRSLCPKCAHASLRATGSAGSRSAPSASRYPPRPGYATPIRHKKDDFHILTPRGTSSSSLGGSAIACAHHPSPELHCNVGNRLQWLISLRMPIAPKRVELAIRSLKVPHAIVLVRLFRLTIADPFPRGGLSPHARTAMWKLPPKSCL